MKKIHLFALCFVLVLLCASVGQAAVFVHEDFEGANVFVDQAGAPGGNGGPNYYIEADRYNGGAMVIPPIGDTPKGLYLRSIAPPPATGISAGRPVFTLTGTKTNARYFRGTGSYQMNAGQGVLAAPPADGQTIPVNNAAVIIQFALSTDAATAALPAGTRVGHFKLDYSTDDTQTVSNSVVFNFDVSATGKLDIESANEGDAVIKSIDCGPGNWTLVTVLAHPGAGTYPDFPADTPPAEGDPNRATYRISSFWDPGTSTWQFVQPYDPSTANPDGENEGYLAATPGPMDYYSAGVHVYADALTSATTVEPNEIGPRWGNSGPASDGQWESVFMGFQLQADNGVLYIDNLLWSNLLGTNQANWREFDHETGLRMSNLNEVTQEPAGPTGAAAGDSWLYY